MFEVLNVWLFECLCPSIAGLKLNFFTHILGKCDISLKIYYYFLNMISLTKEVYLSYLAYVLFIDHKASGPNVINICGHNCIAKKKMYLWKSCIS
jgi:hypothetical protein